MISTKTNGISVDAPAPRVAIIGARGIGRHHANWWRLEGAEVCALVGTSADSVEQAKTAVLSLFPFTGRTYTSIDAMLEAESPDIIDICSPPPLHAQHVRQALEAGCDVLCEKPFVYDPDVPAAELLDQARSLMKLAEDRRRRLAVCTQYSVGARMFWSIWAEHAEGSAITHYHGHLEAPAKGRAPDPQRIWSDLSPHPISVLLHLFPQGSLAPGSMRPCFNGYEASVTFDWQRPNGGLPVSCFIVARNTLQPPANVRHFKLNGYPFAVEGHTDAEGNYCSRIETPDGHYVELDMMRLLIRDFIHGVDVTTADEALRNLELMLAIAEAGRNQS